MINSRRWGKDLSDEERARHGPLGPTSTHPQIKEQAGKYVAFTGDLYAQEIHDGAQLLRMSTEAPRGHGRRLLVVQVDRDLPVLPHLAEVQVWGRVSSEPYSAGG